MKAQQILICLSLLYLGACNQDEVKPEESFVRIYDDPSFDAVYVPKAITEFDNGNYMVLSGVELTDSDYLGVHLMMTNSVGDMSVSERLSEDYVHPLDNIVNLNDSGAYIVCMDQNTFAPYLFSMNNLGNIDDGAGVNGAFWPLALESNDQNIALLSYSSNAIKMNLNIREVNGQVIAANFGNAVDEIGDADVIENQIFNHFRANDVYFPFFVRKVTDQQFLINIFEESTLRLLNVSNGSSDTNGEISGFQTQGGVAAALPIPGTDQLALATYNSFDFSFAPYSQISGKVSIDNIESEIIPEVDRNSEIIIKSVNVKGTSYSLYAGTNKSGQIFLKFYNQVDGSYTAAGQLGFSFKYEAADFIQTKDGGLAVLGTAHLAGRFPRIAIHKLSKKQLEELF